ncbi:hypothetical protein K8S17_02535, partial [bacterium]|nr:hypothetical protein [bacterium]
TETPVADGTIELTQISDLSADPEIVPGPSDEAVLAALLATVAGHALTPEQLDAIDELFGLQHSEIMTRALAHIESGQPGRAEIELSLVPASADTSPAAAYAQLSIMAYSQIIQKRTRHATASMAYAAAVYDHLDTPFHPVMSRSMAMALAFTYVEVARVAPPEERDSLGRQAALWWARADAHDHLSQLARLGPDERLIVAWAYAQIGRVDRATVQIAQARMAYRSMLAADASDAGAHAGLARSYDAHVTGIPAASDADSAHVHRSAADDNTPSTP